MTHKRKYLTPVISVTQLDNEISLALQSTPPFGPDEFSQLKFEEHKTSILKTEIS